MPAKSHYLDNAVLNHVLRNVSLASPAAVYVGLFTVAPTPSTGGTEVAGDTYVRVAATFGAPALGVMTNSAPVTFPAAGALWGSIVAVGIFDLLAGGNLLYFGALSLPKTVDNGDTASFAALALSLTEQ